MLERELSSVLVGESRSLVDVYEHDKVGAELVTFEILWSLALCQVHMLSQSRSACLDLEPKLAPGIGRLNYEVAAREVVPQTTGEVGGYPVHPALCIDRGFTDLAVGLRLPWSMHVEGP